MVNQSGFFGELKVQKLIHASMTGVGIIGVSPLDEVKQMIDQRGLESSFPGTLHSGYSPFGRQAGRVGLGFVLA